MKKSNHTSWLTDQVDEPVPGAPGNRKLERRQRLYRWALIATVPLAPIMLFALIVALLQGTGGDDTPQPVAEVRLDTPGRAAATVTVEDWLSADPAPVPGGGTVLSWDGAETITPPAQPEKLAGTKDDETPPDIELHKFTVADQAGALYAVTVSVAVDDTLGSLVLSAPSLTPLPPSAQSGWPNDMTWPGTVKATADKSVEAAVKGWAEAFTSGDPDKLRIAVADQASDHFYTPLSGVTSVTAQVGQSAYVPTGDESSKKDPKGPVMLANVTLEIVWDGAGTGTDQKPAMVSYDVLVHDANTAAPVVVSWGPTGSGLSLKAHDQAIVGREVVIATPVPGDADEAAATETPADEEKK